MGIRPLSKRSSENSSDLRRRISGIFVMSPSGSTVTKPGELTITWPYFRKMMSSRISLPKDGTKVSAQQVSFLHNVLGISLSTPQRKCTKLKTTGYSRIKSRSSRSQAPGSGVAPSLISSKDIARRLVKKYSGKEVTLKELCDSAEECIQSIRTSSTRLENKSEFLSCTEIDSIIRDITSTTKHRRQHGNR